MSAAQMQPCRCVDCGHDLVIACPNGCPDPDRGLVGNPDPIAHIPPPRAFVAREPGKITRAQTRPRVIEVLRESGAKWIRPRDIAEALGAPVSRIEMMLRTLGEEGVVESMLPVGLKRGKLVRIAQPAAEENVA